MFISRNILSRIFSAIFFMTFAISFSVAGVAIAAFAQATASIAEKSENKAVKAAVTGTAFEKETASQAAPAGKTFLVLDTEWTNVHPKQKVEKSKLEGKADRTMGVGGLMGGGRTGSEKKEELVEVDVPYVVPSFRDHAYVLADGQSHALDKLTESAPGGIGFKTKFSLPKQGDTKKVRFVYLIPAGAANVAFQFFDYSFGHILIPIKGDLKLATGSGGTAGSPARAAALGRLKDDELELAATAFEFSPEYAAAEAPEDWRYAVVKLSGKSLSGGASMKNIVQIKPQGYIWLTTRQGHLYYSCGGSTTDQGFIRFTPEFFQSQEVAFLVPASETEFSLGMRVQNRVYALALNAPPPTVPPDKALATHADGKTLEIFLFGVRRAGDLVILDLGIRSLVTSGADIQPKPQFILEAGGKDVVFDADATMALAHRPPTPFTVPPQGFVRFELAYATEAAPESLRYRGYHSQQSLDLSEAVRK